MYKVIATKQTRKDAINIERSGLKTHVNEIIKVIERNPFELSQDFEELRGKWKGVYSRRINKRHRFVYELLPNIENELDERDCPYDGIVRILAMWTHYERL